MNIRMNMSRAFGQIPTPNPNAASAIADAARHVEQLLQDEQALDSPLDTTPFPRTGIDIPGVEDAEVDVVEVEPSTFPVEPEKDDDSHDGAAGGVVDGGFEYLAFYKSFRDVMRAPAPKRWGIFFIRKRCIALASDMSLSTGESFVDCLDGLVAFLYAHELYHYRFDAHCLQMEATGGQALYRPYCRLVSSRPMAEWHEESIANFYGLKAVQPSHKSTYAQSIYDYLFDLVANSPGAYAGGIDKQKKQAHRKDLMVSQASAAFSHTGLSVWGLGLVESTIRTGTNLSMQHEPSLSYFLRLEDCPVYWIDWVKGGKSVLRPHAVPVSEVNNDFIKRYLAGVQDHHSDHSYVRIDNGELVKLPNPHRADLKNHEFHNIIGKAGMTSPQFYKERARTSVWRKGVPRNPSLPPRFNPKG
jgi:hypothetical protein